jgi:hypothetical protein
MAVGGAGFVELANLIIAQHVFERQQAARPLADVGHTI